MFTQLHIFINQIIDYFKENPIISILSILILWTIFFTNPFESFENQMISVGEATPGSNIGQEQTLGKSSLVTIDPTDLTAVTPLEPSEYEDSRSKLDETNVLKKSGIDLWSQLINPNTAPLKTKKVQNIKKIENANVRGEQQLNNANVRGEQRLNDGNLEGIKKLRSATADLKGIQTNWIGDRSDFHKQLEKKGALFNNDNLTLPRFQI